MVAHSYVGLRAAKYFAAVTPLGSASHAAAYNDAIQSNMDAVEGGSDMPDFLYACGNYSDHHDAGEVAHWPPFHAAYVSYVRTLANFKEGPGQWTEKTKKLVAFLFGVSIHYVTDEMWEGLTTQLANGVNFLAAQNLGAPGNSDRLESPANLGADFYLSFGVNLNDIKPWKRYFPLEDLVHVYHMTPTMKDPTKNFTDVTLRSLENCKLLFDLGLWAEAVLGQTVFTLYTTRIKRLPIIAESVLDTPVGGLDYISVRVQYIWDRIAQWLDVGQPLDPPWRREAVGNDADDRYSHRLFQAMKPFQVYAAQLQAMKTPGDRLFRSVDENDITKGLYFASDENGETAEMAEVICSMLETLVRVKFPDDPLIHDLPIFREAPSKQRPNDPAQMPPPWMNSHLGTLEGNESLGYYGHAFTSGDFDGDGLVDHVVSQYGAGIQGIAPQRGTVLISYGNGKNRSLHGPAKQSRFGFALEVVDLNLDGVDDLIVSAPAYSFSPNEVPVAYNATPVYRSWGKVFVFFGQAKHGVDIDNTLAFYTHHNFAALGRSLSTADVNGDAHKDLLIGAPFSPAQGTGLDGIMRGQVHIVLATKNITSAGASVDIKNGAFITLNGSSPYDLFGTSMIASKQYLYVGAPGHRVDKNNTVGCIYIFDLSSLEPNGSRAVHGIVGTDLLGQFGYSLGLYGLHLIVSAPSAGEEQQGKVLILDLSKLGERESLQGCLQGTIVGTANFGRFGRAIATTEGRLVISAPLSNTGNSWWRKRDRETGTVYVWNGIIPATGNSSSANASQMIQGDRQGGRFGSALSLSSDGILWIGSPRASTNGHEMNGVVDMMAI